MTSDADPIINIDEYSSNFTNNAENFYNNEGCCLKVLVCMCYGLRDDSDNLLLDLEAEPWKSFPIAQIRPNKDMLIKEVTRRWSQSNKDKTNTKIGPRPKQWTLVKIRDWLEVNPIVDPNDVTFLKDVVRTRREIATAAQTEEQENNVRLGAGNWNQTACMRLIHALIDHDDLKTKFLNRLNLPAGRSSVENRQQARESDVWHLLADKWNDKNFSPETISLPAVHTEFTFPDVILHAEVADLAPATAEKVEDKWASMILEMNRCIANWQKSGQGEGGIDDADNVTDQEFGSLANRTQHALSERQHYFRDRQLYLLYLWEMLDRHGLLGSALQRLNNTVSAINGSDGVPSVIRARNNNDADSMSDKTEKTTPSSSANAFMATLGKSIENHGKSLVRVAKIEADEKEKERVHQVQSEIRSILRQLAGEKRSLLIQHVAETQKKNKVMADAIMEQIEEIQMDIDRNNRELVSLDNTPKKRNRTPESAED